MSPSEWFCTITRNSSYPFISSSHLRPRGQEVSGAQQQQQQEAGAQQQQEAETRQDKVFQKKNPPTFFNKIEFHRENVDTLFDSKITMLENLINIMNEEKTKRNYGRL